jgi:hypothetical protein
LVFLYSELKRKIGNQVCTWKLHYVQSAKSFSAPRGGIISGLNSLSAKIPLAISQDEHVPADEKYFFRHQLQFLHANRYMASCHTKLFP